MSKKIFAQLTSPATLFVFGCLVVLLLVSINNLNVGSTQERGPKIEISKANAQEAHDDQAKLEIKEPEGDGIIDLEKALSERSIGSDDAPLVIHEFSSLSCGHCATFHNETLDRLKKEFVDTGKVKIVFHDFPLNRPALFGAVIARCLPEDKYYKFLQLLFSTQEQWAFVSDFDKRLAQNAKLAGMTDEQVTACFSNAQLIQGVVSSVEESRKKYEIRSTPTFVFNDGDDTISGAQSFEVFEEKIKKYIN